MAAWIRLAALWSHTTCYSAKTDVEKLIEDDVEPDDIALIPNENFHTFKTLSTSVRADPAVIHAAQTQKPKEFTATIRREHPNQAIEFTKVRRFVLAESVSDKLDEALAKAESRGAKTVAEQVEAVSVEALQTWEMEEEIEKMAAEMPETEP
jgi:DNA polymerase III delta subunit